MESQMKPFYEEQRFDSRFSAIKHFGEDNVERYVLPNGEFYFSRKATEEIGSTQFKALQFVYLAFNDYSKATYRVGIICEMRIRALEYTLCNVLEVYSQPYGHIERTPSLRPINTLNLMPIQNEDLKKFGINPDPMFYINKKIKEHGWL
jgi:hypothetical protein